MCTIMFSFLCCCCAVMMIPPTAQAGPEQDPQQPAEGILQEMHDLRTESVRLDLKKRYYLQLAKGTREERKRAVEMLEQIALRLAEIEQRWEMIHAEELPGFEQVSADAVLDCSEEPKYGQGSYGIILYATADQEIARGELLLFHAGAIYRTTGTFPQLTTTGQGFYFRPDKAILQGGRCVVACLQNAPEEIENVKNGFMPNSDRARNPLRAYETKVFLQAER